MIARWNLGYEEAGDRYQKLRRIIFSQEPLTPELLMQIKVDRSRGSLKELREGPSDRAGFLREISKATSNSSDANTTVSVLLLCDYVFDDCNRWLELKSREAVSLPQTWLRRIHAPNFSETDFAFHLLVEELKKEEHWPKIQKLIDYAKSRDDL